MWWRLYSGLQQHWPARKGPRQRLATGPLASAASSRRARRLAYSGPSRDTSQAPSSSPSVRSGAALIGRGYVSGNLIINPIDEDLSPNAVVTVNNLLCCLNYPEWVAWMRTGRSCQHCIAVISSVADTLHLMSCARCSGGSHQVVRLHPFEMTHSPQHRFSLTPTTDTFA